MPSVRSKWSPEEIQLCMQTTQISSEGKYTLIPRRGLFLWLLHDYTITGETSGQITEELENGNVLVRLSQSKQTIVVPPKYVSTKQLLTETKVTLVQPIWTLLHIHPSGAISLMTTHTSLSSIRSLQTFITDIIPVPIQSWKE